MRVGRLVPFGTIVGGLGMRIYPSRVRVHGRKDKKSPHGIRIGGLNDYDFSFWDKGLPFWDKGRGVTGEDFPSGVKAVGLRDKDFTFMG